MNLSGSPDFALILFAPWFAILCVLYWLIHGSRGMRGEAGSTPLRC